jgi:Ca2+:H+ antiporter
VRERLEAGGRRGRARGGEGLAYTSHAKRLLDVASKEAREAGSVIGPDHLLLAALHEPRGPMARILGDAGIGPDRVRTVLGGAPSTPPARPTEGTRPDSARPATQDRATAAPLPPASPTRPDAAAPVARHSGLPKHLERRRKVSWRGLLLVMLPVSIVLGYVVHAPPVWVFVTACLGVLPLAGYMGEATEHLAHRTSPTIGGLMNATFGNAAELIIAIVALRAGLVDLVKASITGSILGNLLLILGLAIIAGGVDRKALRFNRTSAGMSSGMLALSVVALVFPALFHGLHPEAGARVSELRMSEAVAVVLLITYGCSLFFTLKTHRRMFGAEAHPLDGPVWSVGRALLVLGGATVGVAVESELLVHAATAATDAVGLSTAFLGLIVIPIIGNAAEHAAAVVLARKGQIELGLQIALGSSTQVALLVAPILVFVGVFMGRDMNLVFQPFEVLALGMATIVTAIITLDGESHWFEGVQLLAVYAMVAVGAFFL